MRFSGLLFAASALAASVNIKSNGPTEFEIANIKNTVPQHLAALSKRHDDMDDMNEPAEENSDNKDETAVESNDNTSSGGMQMDEMSPSPMSMSHHHGRPVLDDPTLEPQQRKYWEMYNTTSFFSAEEGDKVFLWMHTVLVVGSIVFLAPLAVLISEDKRTQWLYVPVEMLETALLIAGIVFLLIYSATAPKLYPGNAYVPYSLILAILVIVRWFAMIMRSISAYMSYEDEYELTGTSESLAANAYALEEFSDEQHEGSTAFESSGSDHENDFGEPTRENKFATNKKPIQSNLIRKFAHNRFFIRINNAVGKFATFVFHLLNIPLFLAELGYLLTGIATAFLMGKGHNVFGLLAHFIKGFVFFLLGFIELARFFGACSSMGYAWNEIYVDASRSYSTGLWRRFQFWPDNPTVEYWQSAAMFFYGSTNVFLEHLGNTDGIWTHKDLQHASIAFMMFGGGLCGMILESHSVKQSMESAFNVVAVDSLSTSNVVRRGWSYNPMPAFIIFWTGALMSHHEQETELSTAIHVQWGTMFSMAAVIRLITLAVLYVRVPPQSEEEAGKPQRPFTEVMVSFLLICGGIIFMSSNRETVESLIYRGIDQMFTLNVSVGVTVLFMALFIIFLSIKGWASRRYQ